MYFAFTHFFLSLNRKVSQQHNDRTKKSAKRKERKKWVKRKHNTSCAFQYCNKNTSHNIQLLFINAKCFQIPPLYCCCEVAARWQNMFWFSLQTELLHHANLHKFIFFLIIIIYYVLLDCTHSLNRFSYCCFAN